MRDTVRRIKNETWSRRKQPDVPDRGDDWVVTGLTFVPDYDAGVMRVRPGYAAITDSGWLYWTDTYEQDVSIPDQSADVYYDVDTSASPMSGEVVVTTGSAPAEPSLQLGTVDASQETFDDTLNRSPSVDYATVTADQMGTDINPTPAIGDVNKTLLATSPDDIQAKLNALPNHGGTVRLLPGDYGDGFTSPDGTWTQTISVPRNSNDQQYCIDMRGSQIDIDTFAGPYIEFQPNAGDNPSPLHIFGPDKFDVNDVSNPSHVMDLWDIESSLIWWPACFGPVDSLVRKNSQEGSGHLNIISASGFGVDKGFLIGDNTASSIGSDRTHWYGQLGSINEIGVHVVEGQTNHFWCQPESGATGYQIEGAGNVIHNAHGAPTAPLDIRADTMVHAPHYASWTDDGSLIASSIIGWSSDRIRTTQVAFDTDKVNSGEFETQNASYNSFGFCQLQPGTTTENTAYFRTPGRAGNNSVLAHASLEPDTLNTGIFRFGLFTDSSNYAVLEVDTASESTWYASLVEGGTETTRTDTGVTATEGNDYKITMNYAVGGTALRFGVVEEGPGFTDEYVVVDPTLNSPISNPAKVAAEVETGGSPGATPEMRLNQLEFAELF